VRVIYGMSFVIITHVKSVLNQHSDKDNLLHCFSSKSPLSSRATTKYQAVRDKRNKSSAIAKIAARCCTSLISASQWGYLSLMHCFLVTSENITTDHILSKSRSFGLNLCCRQCEFNFDQFDVIGCKAIPYLVK